MRTTTTTPIDCPRWCRENHDPREDMNLYGATDHAAALLHDLRGAYVALHRLDRDDAPGQVRIVADPGPAELTPGQTSQFALAVARAAVIADQGQLASSHGW